MTTFYNQPQPTFKSTVVIRGQFTINQSLILPSNVNEIILLGGARVDIAANKSFTAGPDLLIHGCNQLWSYFYLHGNSTIDLTGCTIKDGIYSIFAYGPYTPKIILNSDYFINNYISLMTADFSSPLYEISNTTFTSDPIGLLSPKTGLKSIAGIVSYFNPYMDLHLVNSPNYFMDLRSGIAVHFTNMTIGHDFCIFENIHGMDDQNNPLGTAIWSQGLNNGIGAPYFLIKEANTGVINNPDFNDCSQGLRVEAVNLEVISNVFENVTEGIFLNKCQNKVDLIKENHINCFEHGIRLYQCDQVGTIDILNNEISIDASNSGAYASACIKVDEGASSTFPINRFTIIENHLTVDRNANYGIVCNSAKGTLISENIITLNDYDYNFAGISLVNCYGNDVKCNHITGPGYTNGIVNLLSPFGIYVAATGRSSFSCNETDETYTGLYFNQGCPSTDIRGNDIRDHYWGLFYDQSISINAQYYQGNKWLGTNNPNYPGLAANCLNSPLGKEYYVRPPCQYCLPPTVFPAILWFITDPPGSNFDCNLMTPPCSGGGIKDLSVKDSSLTGLDYLIAYDSLVFPQYDLELNTVNQRYLCDKLNKNPDFLSESPVMQSFYNLPSLNNIKLFIDTKDDLNNAMIVDLSASKSIDSLNQKVLSLYDSVMDITSILRTGLTPSDSIQLTELIGTLKSEIENISCQIMTISQQFSTQKVLLLDNVITENENLPLTLIMELNEKLINDIYLKTIASGNNLFTAEQIEIMRTIAAQCPITGGKAVYLARSLYSATRDTIYNDRELCSMEGGSVIKSQNIILENDNSPHLSIYPNPATNYVQVISDHIIKGEIHIQFFDLLGEKVFEKSIKLESQSASVDIKNCPAGVYFIKCILDNGSIQGKNKLIITR
ncbi:MAG: T9SS type A sorting domain-containing protein [Bacteroidales bacterium]